VKRGRDKLGLGKMATFESLPDWVKRKLECPVCFKTILDPPVYVCVNIHMLCKDCHDQLKSRKQKCPQCRGNFNGKRNLFVENILESIPKTKCKYEGCTFAGVDAEKVKKHENGCKHRTVKCYVCNKDTPLSGLTDHLVSVHKSQKGIKRTLGQAAMPPWYSPPIRERNESIPVTVNGCKDGLEMFFNMIQLDGCRQLMWISHNQSKEETQKYEFTMALLCGKAYDKNQEAKRRLVKFTGYCLPSDVSLDTIKKDMLGLNLGEEFLKKCVDKDNKIRIELRLEKSKDVDNMTQ